MKYELWTYNYICDGDYDWVCVNRGSEKDMLDLAKANGGGRVCLEGEGPYENRI